MLYMDPAYWMFMIPGLLLAMVASVITQATFRKYAKYRASSGLTGAEAARRVLDQAGLVNVTIEPSQGFLSDHYDPRSHTLRLSPPVYQSDSLSAIGVACHEAGHALQHQQEYTPLGMRSTLVPVTQIGSQAAFPIILAGLFFRFPLLINLGCVLFALVVLFTLVTLPVEWDASARAKKLMVSSGIVTEVERESASKVLNAAFMTYVASALTALLTLLYYLSLGQRRR